MVAFQTDRGHDIFAISREVEPLLIEGFEMRQTADAALPIAKAFGASPLTMVTSTATRKSNPV